MVKLKPKTLEPLLALVHFRWALPILAELQHSNGCKFVTLVMRLDLSKDALSRTLTALLEQGFSNLFQFGLCNTGLVQVFPNLSKGAVLEKRRRLAAHVVQDQIRHGFRIILDHFVAETMKGMDVY